ncbi:MAG: methyltransferase domain-containing protein [Armatimonadia bacterium]|nr:methyltransferase domain-containing protein [Armatimonadia bacterium]
MSRRPARWRCASAARAISARRRWRTSSRACGPRWSPTHATAHFPAGARRGPTEGTRVAPNTVDSHGAPRARSAGRVTLTDRSRGPRMRQSELQKMRRLEDTYWWFVGRRHLVRDLIDRFAPEREPRVILDAGCGTGGTLSHLRGMGELWGCDVAPEALAACRKRGFDRLKRSPVQALDFSDDRFDVVVSCDVIEHIEEDRRAMGEMARVLRPGGILVMTVPAHRWLWSAHDEALDHLRRYETAPLREMIESAGLKLELYSKAVAVVMPAILASVAYRRLLRLFRGGPEQEAEQTALFELPRSLNRMLVWLLDLETWLMRYISLPIGASLVAVARKADR